MRTNEDLGAGSTLILCGGVVGDRSKVLPQIFILRVANHADDFVESVWGPGRGLNPETLAHRVNGPIQKLARKLLVHDCHDWRANPIACIEVASGQQRDFQGLKVAWSNPTEIKHPPVIRAIHPSAPSAPIT